MQSVPYHANPGNACALACYTMAAQYLLPDKGVTFEQLGKIGNWHRGYVVWAYPIWKWLMDHGLKITAIEDFDYEAWAREGEHHLRRTLPEKEYNYYKDNSYDLSAVSQQLDVVWNHPNFKFIRMRPTWKVVVSEFNKPGICDLTVNGRKIARKGGLSIHRVVIVDITDEEVVFHDPNEDGSGAYRHEPIEFFRTCFEELDSTDLARYSLE